MWLSFSSTLEHQVYVPNARLKSFPPISQLSLCIIAGVVNAHDFLSSILLPLFAAL